MNVRILTFCAWLVSTLLTVAQTQPGASNLRVFREGKEPATATIKIHAQSRSPYRIPAYITGKFAEHLGANIYNGMDAQILRNPTLAEYPVWTGQMTPDGITRFHSEDDKIDQELRRFAARAGWPDAELENLKQARADALAAWWIREGSREAVQPSPDTGPAGQRAQRLAVRAGGQGLAQWTYLPLHRTNKYEFEIFARSPNITQLSISLTPFSATNPAATATIQGLSPKWQKFTASLELPPCSSPESPYKLAVTAASPGQLVLGRIMLRPADHIQGADPDVIRFLKDSRLPILRWPGGNFVSGYHWEDGIGPVEQRPTRPNYAWGGVEPNTFGTDEFVAFCRVVGCEPMICINGGNGTAAEAARWIEYCNGPATSPMGARRAAHGHPEPYRIKHWEVGNELWGHWQVHWTTAEGYVDRYLEFARAMRAADPSLELSACGAPVFWGKAWNDTLIAGAAPQFQTITDHPLIGGNVPSSVDPLDVYRDFMAVPEVLENKWAALQKDMRQAGIRDPRLAVTELQLFAHLERGHNSNGPVRLTHDKLVNPGTLAEGIYDVLVYHAAARLAPFVQMVTHSATVNHGGGLRKERERVYANPCYYAQAAFAPFGGATPVALEIQTALERAPRVLPELRNAAPKADFGTVDALAALAPDGALLVSLVHRGSAGPIGVTMDLDGFKPSAIASVRTLTAAVPWAVNTLQEPTAVSPVDFKLPVANHRAQLQLSPYSVTRVRFQPE